MATVSLNNVTKVYPNGFQALHGLNLDVGDGEFMVLVGPSGCGKTTALRIVAGLEEITQGVVRIGDRIVNDVEPGDRDIAMVFQNYALYPNMSVRGNIGFALKLRRMPKSEITRRVTDAASLLGLTEWIDRKPSQLSGGQRQRVAMGRAIVREPSVFLMDEPLSNLDAKLRVQMRAEVARIQRRLGVATLYVTHDQVEAMTMGDRVAVMNRGVLQQCDRPRFIYENPLNLFVAGFMGSPPMNLFEGVVGEGAASIRLGSQDIVLPPSVAERASELREYVGRQVVLGVRPEDLSSLRTDEHYDRDLSLLEGQVTLVEALGSEQLVHFVTDARSVGTEHDEDAAGLNEGAINQTGEGVARIDARLDVAADSGVRFGIDPSRLRFFDPATTMAIGTAGSENGAVRGARTREPAEPPSANGADGEADRPEGASLTPLRRDALRRGVPGVSTPSYDPAAVASGIIHFGVGGFHRAHQAMYLDRLLDGGAGTDWGICGVGVMPADAEMAQALAAQDHLYTLVVKHADGRYDARVIGSIVDYLFAPDDPQAVIGRLADPRTEIVSLTITEGGYAIDDVTGRFDPTTPGVAEDLRPGTVPHTVFGLVTAALEQRRRERRTPFTIVSCDNLPGNGSLAREAFVSFARQKNPGLAHWMEQEVRFPNSMVDRITPVTTQADRAEIAARFGINDRWPVVCEPFTQWVLEDAFSSRRPPLEDVGVQIVSDVAPYELMKLRLLNASHQAMAYFGRLLGYTYVHEAAQDPLVRHFLRRYMDEEATPTLDPVPGIDLREYKDTLIERFSNPEIRDTIARLAAESSDRIPKWVLPVIRDQLAHDGPVTQSAAIVASWARYAEGVDEQGEPIEVVDRRRDEVMAAAARQETEPTAFLANRELFGDLVDNERFAAGFLEALRSLHERGAQATLQSLVDAGARSGP
jgi:mannitol 2-dehydrogenase